MTADSCGTQQTVHGWSRFLGHALILVLAVAVMTAGNFGHVVGGRSLLALDRAAELPSAFTHPDVRNADDTLLKPPSPLTKLVNRPREGITVHRVTEGDTVAGIAERYEISVPTLLWANGFAEDDLLAIGRELIILPVSGVLHTVQSGETVEEIARRYLSDAQAIIDFNQITDPEQIVANELLVVPGGRRDERPRPVASTRAALRPMPDDIDEAPAIAAPGTPASPQPLQAAKYTVSDGDTLNGIANKFGVSAETVMWANGLQSNPEFLRPGQELTILPVSGAFHMVAQGDSLSDIASRFGVDIAEIVTANSLASPDKLSVGDKLIIPGAQLATAAEVAAQARAAAEAAAQARAASAARAAAAAAAVKHTVAPGDSLSTIADRYGVSVASITQANDLSSADLVVIGQQLAIPGGRSSSPAVAAAAPAPAPKPAPAAQQAPAQPAPAQPAPAPAPAVSADGNRIVEIASKFLGYRYTWGGHSPAAGFDCSGYTWYVYQQAGIRIPQHDLWGQLQAGPRISRDKLQPGDLVFFQNTYQPGLSHSGIYIGGGRFINAEDYGKGVRVANMNDSYWGPRYFGASRPW